MESATTPSASYINLSFPFIFEYLYIKYIYKYILKRTTIVIIFISVSNPGSGCQCQTQFVFLLTLVNNFKININPNSTVAYTYIIFNAKKELHISSRNALLKEGRNYLKFICGKHEYMDAYFMQPIKKQRVQSIFALHASI